MEHFPIILISIFLLLAFTRIITVLIHEMGHALVGLILFKGNISIYIGSYGDPKKGIHFRIWRLKIHLKYNPLLWGYGLCVSNSTQHKLLSNYLFTLAGPLASLNTTLICLYLLINTQAHGAIRVVALFLFFSSLIDFFQNIRPNENPIFLYDGSITYNDGQSLKLLRSYKGVYNELIKLTEFYTNNKIKEGIDFFKESFSIKKDDNLLRVGADLYMKDENYEEVIELFKQLENNTALTSNDYCNYALAYSHLENHSIALELYKESIKRNPENFFSLNNRGYTLNLIGEYDKAIKDFDKAIEINPKYAYAYNNRGLSKIKLGKEKEGLDDVNKSMELDDQNSYAYKNLGIYHMDERELNTALYLFKKAKELDPKTHGLIDLIIEIENKITAYNNGEHEESL